LTGIPLIQESQLNRNRLFACGALFLLLGAAAPCAEAWGCHGHETIATLAEKHLTPEAKQASLTLLTANPIDPRLKRYCGQRGLDPFVDASTWADDERNVEPATGPWHFIDIPLGVTTPAQIKTFCGSGGCVIQAITDQLAILKDKSAPGAKRATALRFIIHLVGDLHQPLHATSNADRGGNCVPVQYFRRKPRAKNNSYTPNLHQIWDTAIPERDMEGADASEFADKLDAEFAGSFSAWQQGGMQLEAWAWEGHQQAVATVYGALGTPIAKEPEVLVNSCADDNNIGQRMLEKHIAVGAAYEEQAAAVAEERLAQAAIRLAMILNDAAKSSL
jgi:S1/P1 Nuclease